MTIHTLPASMAYEVYRHAHGEIFGSPPWEKLPLAFQDGWETAIMAAAHGDIICGRAFYDHFCDQREGKDFRGEPLRCWAALIPDTRRAFEDALMAFIKYTAQGQA